MNNKKLIMIGIEIKDGFLDFSKTEFECPHCKEKYTDENDKYLKRCNKNKSGVTKINCKCDKSFFMTYDYKGDAFSFQ